MAQRNRSVPRPYPAERAGSGEVILGTPLRRAAVISGLAGAALLGLLTFAH
jgi:hypothetical protein